MSACEGTPEEVAREFVDLCLPALRQSLRLPQYSQPLIRWEFGPSADPTFVAFMRKTWSRLDLRDPVQFREQDAFFLRYFRLHGLRKMLETVRRYGIEVDTGFSLHFELCYNLLTLANEGLYHLIPPHERLQWFPWHAFCLKAGRKINEFTLHVDSLSVHQLGNGELVYYSHRRPTVLLQGMRLPVAFSSHALHRIHERLEGLPGSHSSFLNAFAYTAYLQTFTPAQLYPAQPAFALAGRCLPGWWTTVFAKTILGVDVDPDTHAYRLGYCPALKTEGFHVAKTLLLPGYVSTPEFNTVLRTSLDRGVKEALIKRCKCASVAAMAQEPDLDLLRWFHIHGVPQVFPAPDNMFLYK